MSIKVGRCLTTVAVFSLLIQIQFTVNGYAARGTKIAFTSTRQDGLREIYVMDGDGGNQVRLTYHAGRDGGASWSPDGRRIAFVSNRDRGYDRIYVMDSDGQNMKRLTKDSTNRHPAWSPDGGRIAFTRNTQICVMDTDGKNLVPLTHIGFNTQPTWSPDGKRIGFVSHRDGGAEIYVMDQDGSNQERRTGNKAVKSAPAWSPDGRLIAYSSLDLQKVFQIYVVRSDGVPLKKKLTRKPPNKFHPVWSPDGDTIAYTSEVAFGNTRIHLMSDKGIFLKQFREVGNGSDMSPDWVDPAAWSVPPAENVVTSWGKIKKPRSALQ